MTAGCFQELVDIDMVRGNAREDKSDLIFFERTRRLFARASRRPRFPNELVVSSPNKEFRVSKLRILATELKSSSESHSIVGKEKTSSLKLRSNRDEDNVTSKLLDLDFGAFTS